MKKYLLVLVGLCCVLSYALAERPDYPELKKSDANIIGHVLDKKTKEHLPYITIALKGTTIGTVTDATGHYFLKNLPEGNFILEVSSVGYKTVTRNVTLKKGKTLEEDFEIEEDAIALDGVVVSANRSETTRRMAPTLVNVVDLKLFETTNSSTLSQGLNFQPGVRVETNCQNCGFQQVRINGLDGPYTQILIDSRPVFSALSGVYGLEQIPASMIERVEVMRGGGSALFGSSAIAGTINIITKEPLRNSGQLSHTITSLGGSSSFDNNTSLNASLVTDDHRAGLYIFGQNRYRSGYDYDGDGFTELPKLKNQTVGFRSYLENKAGILALIRSNQEPDAKERSIKTAFPKDYAFLLKEVYPGLRHSDYAVKYEVRTYTDINEIKRLIKTQPQKLSLNEMYLAAQDMKLGSEEYNETFEVAVRMFPDDEVANLNAANAAMARGDMKNAEYYLKKAGNSPQAVYGRGTYAALKKEFDMAEKMFTEAAHRGLADAEEMLKQIEEIKH